MKYCNDCLTPIKSDSREEYCALCKKARALKENSVAQDSDFLVKLLNGIFAFAFYLTISITTGTNLRTAKVAGLEGLGTQFGLILDPLTVRIKCKSMN